MAERQSRSVYAPGEAPIGMVVLRSPDPLPGADRALGVVVRLDLGTLEARPQTHL